MDSTYKFTNNSNPSLTYWDLEMAMEDNHNNNNILPHQNIIPSDHLNSFWPNFPSSSSTLFVPDDDHNNNHQLLLEDQRQEDDQNDEQEEELGAMKEMMYKIAAMQPVDIDPATIRKPKRRNVRISEDPQSVAARHRRERISERIRILQRLVPGGTKMDTASMLDEAIKYVKFLKRQIRLLQSNTTTVSLAPSSPDNWAFTIPAKTSSETAPGTAGEGGFATTFGV